MSATAAYRHFENRQDLVTAVAEQGFLAMLDRISTEPVTDSGEPPRGERRGLAAYAELRNIVMGLLDHASEERPWTRLMLDEWAEFNDGTSEGGWNIGESLSIPLREPLRAGAEVGFFRDDIDDADESRLWLGVLSLTTSLVFEIFPGQTLQEMLGANGRQLADLTVQHLLTERGRALLAEANGGPDGRVDDLEEWVSAEVGTTTVH